MFDKLDISVMQISRSVIASPGLPTLHRVPVTSQAHVRVRQMHLPCCSSRCSCARFDAATYALVAMDTKTSLGQAVTQTQSTRHGSCD
uniref:Uncharacterized protein n=1 Tax=Peronospora matthiolae TaxID=2874970 RepID=A0AAV1UUR0_9STRA